MRYLIALLGLLIVISATAPVTANPKCNSGGFRVPCG
jgi:hypothetical protein